MANELDRRYGAQNLHATSLHPGGINTNISRHVGKKFAERIMANEAISKTLKSSEQGAATTIVAAVGKERARKGGRYLEDCQEAGRGEEDGNSLESGYVQQTYNPAVEARLWKESLKIVGLDD